MDKPCPYRRSQLFLPVYMAAVKVHFAWLRWQELALAEPWIVEEDEA